MTKTINKNEVHQAVIKANDEGNPALWRAVGALDGFRDKVDVAAIEGLEAKFAEAEEAIRKAQEAFHAALTVANEFSRGEG